MPTVDFEEALLAYISFQVPSLSSHIFPDRLDQTGSTPVDVLRTILPAMVYSEIGHAYANVLSGSAGYSHVMYQLGFWSSRRSEARSTRELARLKLHGYGNAMIGNSATQFFVQHILAVNARVILDVETGLFCAQLDLTAMLPDAVPEFWWEKTGT